MWTLKLVWGAANNCTSTWICYTFFFDVLYFIHYSFRLAVFLLIPQKKITKRNKTQTDCFNYLLCVIWPHRQTIFRKPEKKKNKQTRRLKRTRTKCELHSYIKLFIYAIWLPKSTANHNQKHVIICKISCKKTNFMVLPSVDFWALDGKCVF